MGDPALEFGLLGPLEVRNANAPIEISSPKHRILLATLLLHAERLVPTGKLATALPLLLRALGLTDAEIPPDTDSRTGLYRSSWTDAGCSSCSTTPARPSKYDSCFPEVLATTPW